MYLMYRYNEICDNPSYSAKRPREQLTRHPSGGLVRLICQSTPGEDPRAVV